MMIEAACCLLDTADQGLGLHRREVQGSRSRSRTVAAPATGSGGDLRSGWGTPVYHLAHLGFYERLVSLGFGLPLLPGGPYKLLSKRREQNARLESMPI